MDRPAPPHSDPLNRMVGITPPPDAPEADVIDPIEYEQRRVALRRKAAGRARARRVQAA